MSCAFLCVAVSSQASAGWVPPLLSHEWAMGSVNSSRWKGLGPGILYSLSRYSLDNPRKFFPPCCPSKISQGCLERSTWRVRKQFLFLYLVLAGHHRDLGAVIDVAGKQIFPRESCVKKTPDLPSRGYLLQNGFVGSQSAGLWWVGFCAFWSAWRQKLRPVVFCFMFEHQWWRAGCLAVCHPVYRVSAPTGMNSFGTTAQLAGLCAPLW